jgi:hypothetical protein
MGKAGSTNWEKMNAYRASAGKPEGKETLGRPKCNGSITLKFLREIEWGGIACTDLAQDSDQWRALVNTVMNLRVLENVGKFLSS